MKNLYEKLVSFINSHPVTRKDCEDKQKLDTLISERDELLREHKKTILEKLEIDRKIKILEDIEKTWPKHKPGDIK